MFRIGEVRDSFTGHVETALDIVCIGEEGAGRG